ELRRQADIFLDIVDLQTKIGRDPTERPAREPRDARDQRQHTPQFLQRGSAPPRSPVPAGTEDEDFEECSAAMAEPRRNCARCPRLLACREIWRAREPEWFNAPVPSFGSPDARVLIVGL